MAKSLKAFLSRPVNIYLMRIFDKTPVCVLLEDRNINVATILVFSQDGWSSCISVFTGFSSRPCCHVICALHLQDKYDQINQNIRSAV